MFDLINSIQTFIGSIRSFFLMDSGFCVHELERHQTEDTTDSHVNGELTVIWRDWDKIIKDPKMIYLNLNKCKSNQRSTSA